MKAKISRRVATLSTASATTLITATTPAAAAHDSMQCDVPTALTPLIDLLHSFTELAFIAGILLGTIGFMTAGILIAGPFGDDWTRRGKGIAKNTMFGTILLLSSHMIVAFLVGELGGVICT